MNQERTCCVTGHRQIPDDRKAWVGDELRRVIQRTIDQGYTHFISGFANGTDLMFAGIVADWKQSCPITLEAAIPYPGRMKTPDQTFQRLIGYCDVVKVHSEHYFKGCYAVRNRYMVDVSQLVIAVWDGRECGGTAATARYAVSKKKHLHRIAL